MLTSYKKNIFLYSIFFLCSTKALAQHNAIDPFAFSTHGISFEIDDSEKYKPNSYELGTVSESLYIQLLQQACVVVTTASLLKNVMYYLNEPDNKNLPSVFQFKSSQWIKKRSNNDVYVLVPKKLMPELNAYNTTRTLASNEPLTPAEKACGIKIDHMENIPDEEFFKPDFYKPSSPPHYSNDTYPLMNNLTTALWDGVRSSIFVTNADYLSFGPETPIPTWAIYWEGHGSDYGIEKNKNINLWLLGGVTQNTLGAYLKFFNTKIHTALFFIETCYGGATQLQEIQKYISKDPQFKNLNYIIISGTAFNAPEMGLRLTQEEHYSARENFYKKNKGSNQKKPTALGYTKPRYDLFFKDLQKAPPIDISEIIKKIYSPLEDASSFANLPIIIMPGQSASQLLDVNKSLVQIQRTLARARDPQAPLNISEFFAGKTKTGEHQNIYPSVIALFTPEVPFPLIYEKDPSGTKKHIPALVSLIPGAALHTLNTIDAHEFNLSDFIASFFLIQELQETKIFKINTVKLRNDLTLPNFAQPKTDITISNVVALNSRTSEQNKEKPERLFYFDYNGTTWRLELTHYKQPEGSKKKSTLQNFVAKNLKQDPEHKHRDASAERIQKKFAREIRFTLPENSLFKVDLSAVKKNIEQKKLQQSLPKPTEQPKTAAPQASTEPDKQKKEQALTHLAQALSSLGMSTKTAPSQQSSPKKIENAHAKTPQKEPGKQQDQTSPLSRKQLIQQSTKPVIIEIGAKWCGPCKQIKPIFKKLSAELGSTYLFVELDADNEQDIELLYQLKALDESGNISLPTFVFMKNKKIIAKKEGYMNEQELRNTLKQYLG